MTLIIGFARIDASVSILTVIVVREEAFAAELKPRLSPANVRHRLQAEIPSAVDPSRRLIKLGKHELAMP